MVKNIHVMNLRIRDIDEDKIIEILEKISIEVDKYIRNRTPPRTDYDLVLRVDKNGEITILVDIGVKGSYEDVINYKSIVDDVINIVRELFEKELERFREDSGEETKLNK